MEPTKFYSTFMAFFLECIKNQFIIFMLYAVIFDSFFGFVRSLREHKTNSSVGIDGLIRKAGMMASLCFFAVLDRMMSINLIGFLPEEIKEYLPAEVGTVVFFALLFLAFEVVSILKNMYLCGLPVKWVWIKVYKFLTKYTDELPDDCEYEDMRRKLKGIQEYTTVEENGGADE